MKVTRDPPASSTVPFSTRSIAYPTPETLTKAVHRRRYKVLSLFSFGGSIGLIFDLAIRVFGIFSLKELGRSRFWNTLSRHSQQRGPEYIRRCILQCEPQLGGGGPILPTLFPPLPEQDEDTQETLPPSISEEEIKEVSDKRVSAGENI